MKKLFLNLSAGLFCVVFTGNVIAGDNAGQINQFLGTKTSMTVSTLPEGQEETYARYFDSKFSSIAELKAAGEAKVREVESEGIVLLKNDNGTLPLAAGSKVSLIGVTAMDPVYGGTGSGAVDADGAPNYYDVLTGAGFEVLDKPLLDYYVENEAKRNTYEIGEVRWKKASKNHDDTIGQGEDAIYVVGRLGGEGDDVTAEKEDALDGDYLTLNEDERSILEGLKELKDDGALRSVTVIINSANPISTAFLSEEDYGVDAALWVGSVGQTGLCAVGDVLSGTVNPSGSLPDTWWMDNRAGIGTWLPEQALREIYLRAFELPILNADAMCVMTGYNRLGVNWCGAYPELLTDWLRGEAGMRRFAVSDMYDASYMVPVHEIAAGNDIPDGELDLTSLTAYGPKGATPNAAVAQAMRESTKRVMYTVLHSRGMDGISEYTKVVTLTPWWQTELNVAQWTLLGLTAVALALLLWDIFGKKQKKAA